MICLDGEHRMPIPLLVTHDRDEQRLAGPAGLHQQLALEQDVILAVAETVVGIIPAFGHTPMFKVGHRFDGVVDPFVDSYELIPSFTRQHGVGRRQWHRVAFRGVVHAELFPSDRRAGSGAERNK